MPLPFVRSRLAVSGRCYNVAMAVRDEDGDGAVLGYDVGWSLQRASSAACLLAWDARSARLSLRRFTAQPAAVRAAVGDLAGGRRLLAAAFDGPLNATLSEIGLHRQGDRILTVGIARHIGKPGQCNVPNGRRLNAAANEAVHAVLAAADVAPAAHAAAIHACAIAEAFPTSFLGLLLDAGQTGRDGWRARSDLYYVRATAGAGGGRLGALLRRLLPGRKVTPPLDSVSDHDERAAVACAVTALCVARRRYLAVGDGVHGWHVLPPPAPKAGAPGIQPWALAILRANAGAGAMIIEDGRRRPVSAEGVPQTR